MQRSLFIKLAIIAGICLLLAIGLSMIDGMIVERQNYAQSVQIDIAKQHVNEQVITTPFILSNNMLSASIHATSCQNHHVNDMQDQDKNQGNDGQSFTSQAMPKTARAMAGNGDVNSYCDEPLTTKITPYFATQTVIEQSLKVNDDVYSRSVYAITSYKGDILITQQYQLPNHPITTAKITADDAVLVIPISDIRGVADLPTVMINGKKMIANFAKQHRLGMENYLEVPLTESIMATGQLQVSIKMPVLGLSRMRLEPLGDNVVFKMQADWSSPLFIGTALPVDKTINSQGFKAIWQNQSIASKNTQTLSNCLQQGEQNCQLVSNRIATQTAQTIAYQDEHDKQGYQSVLSSFGVDFATPNDIYRQTERALKYGLLIVFISFGSFFLFEVTKSLRIHPIQYVLVGAALVVFYMLLLPLAEQMLFWQAYLIAATACVSLITWYAFYVLHQWRRALVFGAILSSQYVAFYLLLTLDGFNLLVGAIMCFVLIAVVMYLTRHVDWYKIA